MSAEHASLSAHGSFFRPGRATTKAAVAASKIRLRCDICTRMFGANCLAHHRRGCLGLPTRVSRDEKQCANNCGRVIPATGALCFRCGAKDAHFGELDELIRSEA